MGSTHSSSPMIKHINYNNVRDDVSVVVPPISSCIDDPKSFETSHHSSEALSAPIPPKLAPSLKQVRTTEERMPPLVLGMSALRHDPPRYGQSLFTSSSSESASPTLESDSAPPPVQQPRGEGPLTTLHLTRSLSGIRRKSLEPSSSYVTPPPPHSSTTPTSRRASVLGLSNDRRPSMHDLEEWQREIILSSSPQLSHTNSSTPCDLPAHHLATVHSRYTSSGGSSSAASSSASSNSSSSCSPVLPTVRYSIPPPIDANQIMQGSYQQRRHHSLVRTPLQAALQHQQQQQPQLLPSSQLAGKSPLMSPYLSPLQLNQRSTHRMYATAKLAHCAHCHRLLPPNILLKSDSGSYYSYCGKDCYWSGRIERGSFELTAEEEGLPLEEDELFQQRLKMDQDFVPLSPTPEHHPQFMMMDKPNPLLHEEGEGEEEEQEGIEGDIDSGSSSSPDKENYHDDDLNASLEVPTRARTQAIPIPRRNNKLRR